MYNLQQNFLAFKNLKKPKAIVFDWDNTLVDTWPIIHMAINQTMQTMQTMVLRDNNAINAVGKFQVVMTHHF